MATDRKTRHELLETIRSGGRLSSGEQLRLVLILCIPAILAQFSTIMMEYIDAGMVGRLGARESAAIGLVATSTWLFGGFCMATSSGFSVQVAHLIGAGNFVKARSVLRQALTSNICFSIVLSILGIGISNHLPVWLGGDESIIGDAAAYFRIYSCFLPFMMLAFCSGAMLQATGNMKVPSILNVAMCVLDVIFNYIFIYGCSMGVRGAALGTGVAEVVISLVMLGYQMTRSEELAFIHEKGSFIPQKETLRTAFKVSAPMWLENIVMRGAYVASTIIVAPLGTIAIAANAFAVTAESFCYMPGYGLQEAGTTIVGQSLGASRKYLARRFSFICVSGGAIVMGLLAMVMYAFAPELMGMLSTDAQVVDLGARVLRIEAWAEVMYGVSIVAYGCFVGAGDTLVPSIMNLASIWFVRIGLSVFLTPRYGLVGYWIAMCIELNVRGLLFLIRLLGRRWMKTRIQTA